MKRYIGDILLLITAIVWGSGFVMTAIALEHLTAYEVMAGRFLLGTLIITVLFYKKLRLISKSVLWKGAVLGTILFVAFALQTVGLEYTTPSKNAFLTAVNVVIVPVIAYLVYRRRIDRHELMASVIALTGIAFLSLQGSFTINIGDLLTLLCAVGFAFDIFYTNMFVKKEDALVLTIVQFATAALLSTVAVLFQGGFPSNPSNEAIWSVVYLAVFSTTIAYVCQNLAFRYTTPTKAAVILSLESFFGSVLAVLFINDVMTGRMVFGAALILVAVLVAEVKPAFRLKSSVRTDH
ncbi:putative DMT superfamily transporter inner membrane protein [Bhargavaea cecembensis DSE10]|uniref:Putative DMT superfamily transporter inner membrane protein n=1 Tax=Bhargavaea cecembensis DSE10 TaxID=1235279 RepID=M7NZP3_9BACL|nr:DMT family transporter [Bhargavaea cecembensis]EMR07150.1 putative DMT superfamily transporter inner membrane protein [Bhargavaea cecembensis DSE10]